MSIRVSIGQRLRNVSAAHFADRASGLSLKPGECAVVDPQHFDDDFQCSGDPLEGISLAVRCGVLQIEQ